MPNPQDISTPKSKSAISGCLIALVVPVALLVALAIATGYVIRRDQAEFDRHKQERRLETIAEVRSGREEVSVFYVELLEMLVDDPLCVQTVKSVMFTMADLGDPRFRRFKELVNVTDLGFYSCSNADNVMGVAKDMDSIESLYFEVTQLSDQSLDSLAEFPNLKEVRFEQMVDDETFDRLNELLPGVNIEIP